MDRQEQVVAKTQSGPIVWTDQTVSLLDGDERFTTMVDMITLELTREGASFDWARCRLGQRAQCRRFSAPNS